MNPIELTARAMLAVGDIVIFIALVSAVLLLFFNTIDNFFSDTGSIPVQVMVVGWIGFLTVFGGLVAVTTTGLEQIRIGYMFGINMGVVALLLMALLLLLATGTSWRLASRYLVD